jgi:hypothetical protein
MVGYARLMAVIAMTGPSLLLRGQYHCDLWSHSFLCDTLMKYFSKGSVGSMFK